MEIVNMKGLYLALGTSLFVLLSPTASLADISDAEAHYNNLSREDQVLSTLGLIATGDFNGFHGHGFTERYYKAILAYEKRKRLVIDGKLQAWELQGLKEQFYSFFHQYPMNDEVHPVTGASVGVPTSHFDTVDAYEKGLIYSRHDNQLSLSFAAHSRFDQSFEAMFEILRKPNSDREITYSRLRPTFFVVTGINKSRKFYTYMAASAYGTTGFTLTWGPDYENVSGRLTTLMANSFVPEPKEKQPGASSPPQVSAEPPPVVDSNAEATESEKPQNGTGTGFKVGSDGHVLTNFHVAGKCKSIGLRKPGAFPTSARLVAGDERNDLALLRADQPIDGPVAEFRDGTPVKAGAEIVVYGFPLSSLLSSSGNIVTGNVTSLAGLGDNTSLYQVSAPVQPGNSGGPVLDREGRVIGVVVSKLNTLAVAKITDDVPQNVNFAIKGSVVKNFLESANISIVRQPSAISLETTVIAERAQAFTYLIECTN